MSSITIQSCRSLSGEVDIQGSKNSALPILAASLLNIGVTVIQNCPYITDVLNMIEVLKQLGCIVIWNRGDLIIDASVLTKAKVSKKMAKKFRGSIMFLGALAGKKKKVKIATPGGCSIGARKIDFHLNALTEMGAVIQPRSEKSRWVKADATALHSADIEFPFPSVGATENAILASVLTEGTTVISNAACEPEVQNLCEFLVNAGAKIHGIGTHTLIIEGVKSLHDSTYAMPPDRIVAGTYLVAVAAAGGKADIHGVVEKDLKIVIDLLRKMGCTITLDGQTAHIERIGPLRSPGTLATEPFPGFPTDMQSQFLVLFTQVEGISCIKEQIFENRFHIIQELNHLGAKIDVVNADGQIVTGHNCNDCTARVTGGTKLIGTEVVAKELRGAAALIVAGLIAEGTTVVNDVDYVNRGYVDICKDLNRLGANLSYRK